MSKRTIDLLGRMIRDLDDNEIAGGVMHKIVGNAVAMHKSADPVKVMVLAQDIYKLGRVELDDADFDIVEQAVRSYDGITPFVKGQILVALKDSATKTETGKKGA